MTRHLCARLPVVLRSPSGEQKRGRDDSLPIDAWMRAKWQDRRAGQFECSIAADEIDCMTQKCISRARGAINKRYALGQERGIRMDFV